MTDQLNHVLSLVAHGLLTELPAQLTTAALMAAAAAAWRYAKRRSASKERAEPAVPGGGADRSPGPRGIGSHGSAEDGHGPGGPGER
ncbi:hypothetical protein JK361_12880 [Streptomyces sp. 5-8]|uniref:Uncharacterized protein n=1 Tax=Streptomyces musisoli TaxID=2802280 RepID=A0ABS1P057_9ACTN|nr:MULTISPECIES: hypothetical protein [Streptomyces]MBL1105472.1 hypothetical protein [Streptomyces musisoli]MBY8845154.1 hypothetical protein [Streptomyces sp. SP2-10]